MINNEIRDYSLLGTEAKMAIEKGLANAQWYKCPIDQEKLRKLLIRKNGPAIRDTLIWFLLLIGSGILTYILWGTLWAVLPYIIYSVIYASSSDSRWHEASHGTPFKTDWMNKALYELASFMVIRQSVPWQWSHIRHHSDTIIRGRDPEIAVPRPPKSPFFRFLGFLAIESTITEFKKIFRHALGKIDPYVATYLPESEYRKVFVRARIYLLIYFSVIVLIVLTKSILPLMYIGIPTFVGSWLMVIYGTTQHAGLAENVLDHRLNCRTVYMNRINRYLYWNMNYHIEHHMFPLVPYHALPQLHELIKNDCPEPYKSIADAYREINPTLKKQRLDCTYFVHRILPDKLTNDKSSKIFKSDISMLSRNGYEVCTLNEISKGEVVRFDISENTYAVYRTTKNEFFATDGYCTHGKEHLAEGYIVDSMIECPKHNGRFNLSDGTIARKPVCKNIKTYKINIIDDRIFITI